jgi:hypothetical protein
VFLVSSRHGRLTRTQIELSRLKKSVVLHDCQSALPPLEKPSDPRSFAAIALIGVVWAGAIASRTGERLDRIRRRAKAAGRFLGLPKRPDGSYCIAEGARLGPGTK